MHCERFKVYGRVQGVGFRAGTQNQARALGLNGWVRNDVAGFVEVLACGEAEVVERLHQWLHAGPTAAVVDAVAREDCAGDKPDAACSPFAIR